MKIQRLKKKALLFIVAIQLAAILALASHSPGYALTAEDSNRVVLPAGAEYIDSAEHVDGAEYID